MTLAMIYPVPFWKRRRYGGRWAVWAQLNRDWTFVKYFPTFRAAWFHLLVSYGWRDYPDERTVTR